MRHFEKQGLTSPNKNELVHVYSFGTPSCVDANLADDPRTLGLVTSGKQPVDYFCQTLKHYYLVKRPGVFPSDFNDLITLIVFVLSRSSCTP